MTTNNKYKFGQVFTPRHLVHEMWTLLKSQIMNNNMKNISIFEPGAGEGIFYDVFFQVFQDVDYSQYIMNEINQSDMASSLLSLLNNYNSSKRDKVLFSDFFTIQPEILSDGNGFDFIVGNLPFHIHGMKQVPSAKFETNKHNTEELTNVKEGKTIWTDMVKKMVSNDCFLKPGGYGMLIIPLIWLKPDKGGIYKLLTHTCTLLYLKTYTSTEANKTFGYNAQTPLCYVIFQKIKPENNQHQIFKIYDHETSNFVSLKLFLNQGLCIPTKHISNHNHVLEWWQKVSVELGIDIIFSKYSLSNKLKKVCHMKKEVIQNKTYECKIDSNTFNPKNEEYFNITGAELREKNGDIHDCLIKGFYGTYPGAHHGIPKVILPHKRFGFSVVDTDGVYGLYGRDKYVFLFPENEYKDKKERNQKMMKLHQFLKLEVVQHMIESFKIRMSFIEKYIFDYIPNILDEKYGDYFYDSFMQAFSQP